MNASPVPLLLIAINTKPQRTAGRITEKINLRKHLIPEDQLRAKKGLEIIFFRSVPNCFQYPSKEHVYRPKTSFYGLRIKPQSGRNRLHAFICTYIPHWREVSCSCPIISRKQSFGELNSWLIIVCHIQDMLPLRKGQLRTLLPFVF